MSRTRKKGKRAAMVRGGVPADRLHKDHDGPRCGTCHPDKLDGNSLKNANRQEMDRRAQLLWDEALG